METRGDLYTIDLGNSNPHVGVFRDGQLLVDTRWTNALWQELIKENVPLCLANVGVAYTELSGAKNILQVASKKQNGSFLDMKSDYSETIGDDRIVQAYYLYHKYLLTGKTPSMMLIDAGTFITVDFLTSNGHHGGLIFPGPQTFLNSYTNGAHLPKLNAAGLRDDFLSAPVSLGRTTQEAIIQALKFYLIQTVKSSHADMVVLTGGHAQLLLPSVKAIYKDRVILDNQLIHYSLANFYEKVHSEETTCISY